MASSPFDVGKRERQIVEAVYRLGEASVAEAREALVDPPSYSAVRAMLGLLVEKGVLKYRQDGMRYLYRPALPLQKARRSAMERVMSTFFAGQPLDAVAALLDVSSADLTGDDLKRMKLLIEQAQREKRS